MDWSILFHAQRGTLGKKTKFNSLMVDWHSSFHLPQGHSTQLQTWHHISVILDTTCPKTFLEHLHYFHRWFVYFRQNTKEVFKEFLKTTDAKTLKQHQRFFLECIYLSLLMVSMLKSYPSHVLVLFSDVMDGFGSSFSSHFPLVCWRLQTKLKITHWWESVCLILCCWMISLWNLPNHS